MTSSSTHQRSTSTPTPERDLGVLSPTSPSYAMEQFLSRSRAVAKVGREPPCAWPRDSRSNRRSTSSNTDEEIECKPSLFRESIFQGPHIFTPVPATRRQTRLNPNRRHFQVAPSGRSDGFFQMQGSRDQDARLRQIHPASHDAGREPRQPLKPCPPGFKKLKPGDYLVRVVAGGRRTRTPVAFCLDRIDVEGAAPKMPEFSDTLWAMPADWPKRSRSLEEALPRSAEVALTARCYPASRVLTIVPSPALSVKQVPRSGPC